MYLLCGCNTALSIPYTALHTEYAALPEENMGIPSALWFSDRDQFHWILTLTQNDRHPRLTQIANTLHSKRVTVHCALSNV